MALLALICSRFLNLFSDYNMFNCCFNGKEEFCGCEQRNMKGVVAFLWEEYENIHWQRSYGEQLSQFDNAVRFSTFMSTAGHVVPGWEIPQRLEAECIGCWPGWQCWKSGVGSGKKRKMTFYGLETVREKKKNPNHQFGMQGKSLWKMPLPRLLCLRGWVYLEIQVLKIPVLTSKTFAFLPPTKGLFLCKFAAYLYVLKALEVSLFIC